MLFARSTGQAGGMTGCAQSVALRGPVPWMKEKEGRNTHILQRLFAYFCTKAMVWEEADMKGNPEERAISLGEYITEKQATVRAAAKAFGVSKSTVHKDIQTRLSRQNAVLYKEVQKVLEKNKAERHLRGGEATRRKYKNLD